MCVYGGGRVGAGAGVWKVLVFTSDFYHAQFHSRLKNNFCEEDIAKI